MKLVSKMRKALCFLLAVALLSPIVCCNDAYATGSVSFGFSLSSDVVVEGKQYEITVSAKNETGNGIAKNYYLKLYKQIGDQRTLLCEKKQSSQLKNNGSKSITYGVWTAEKNCSFVAELWVNGAETATYSSTPFSPVFSDEAPESYVYLDDQFQVTLNDEIKTLYVQAFRFTEDTVDSYHIYKVSEDTRKVEIVLKPNMASDASVGIGIEFAKPTDINRIGFNLNNSDKPINTNSSAFPFSVNLYDNVAECEIGVYDNPGLKTGLAGNANYLGRVLTYQLHFEIADESTVNDPAPDTVVSIAIKSPPLKTKYIEGERFAKNGMYVEATLDDGNTCKIAGYNYMPTGQLQLSDKTVTVSYGNVTAQQSIHVIPMFGISDIVMDNGWMIPDNRVLTENGLLPSDNLFRAITRYGEETGKLSFTVSEHTKVLIDGIEQTIIDGVCSIEIPSSEAFDTDQRKGIDGAKTVVTLVDADGSGDTQKEYVFQCCKQLYPDMPVDIVDYLCIGSQYTNGYPYGVNAISTLRGENIDTTTSTVTTGPVSLGNFGGYIVYYFDQEHPITDKSNNPYGVDFLIHGNSVDGTHGFAEPGQVWISEDKTTWYALAGSIHYEDFAVWDYAMTYKDDNTWLDNKGNSGTIRFGFPLRENYPLYAWPSESVAELTVSGIYFKPVGGTNEYNNVLPPYPAFGYVDVHNLGNTNIATNPYAEGGSYYDAFDLAWAVDADGRPVDVSSKEFHYVKIQTTSFIDNGSIGEKSTEINMMRVAQPADSDVGQTDAPTALTIDGQSVAVGNTGGEYQVTASGPFSVEVTALEGANVYINGERTTSRKFDAIPTHGIIRVIVQEGQKAPWIGYLELTEGAPEADAVTLYFVDADTTITGIYDASLNGYPLPERTVTATNRHFVGWTYGQKTYTSYVHGELPDGATLTAVWQTDKTPSQNNITVSFRLIGSSKSKSDIDLADGDYRGAEYQTWIATSDYTLLEGSTAIDLMEAALARAGLETSNPGGNYIEGIYAPASLGGQEMREFTNGPRSGWMYTLNGVHANLGVAQQVLEDGDAVILHYVDDYAYEVADWDRLGGVGYPALGDSTYHNAWLAAPDVNPNAPDYSGGVPSGNTDSDKKDETKTDATATVADNGEVVLAPEVTDGEAKAEVSAETVVEALKESKDANVLTVTVDTTDADKVEATLDADAVKAAAEADVDLHVETEVGTVKVDSDTLVELAEDGKDIAVTVTTNEDGTTTIDVTADGESVDAKVKVELPAAEDNQVLVIVDADGKETVIKKSLVEGDKVYAEIPAGATVKVVEADGVEFGDVADSAWYADAVEFVASHELFQGTNNGFEPDTTMNRAMLVAVLYRLEDASASGGSTFADVDPASWYAEAVAWADETGIVTGTDNGFEPNAPVTREQIATILYRYANVIGLDTSTKSSLSGFPDGGETSSWASDAMQWAVSVGLFQGDGHGALNPKGDATRAQVATLFERLVGLIVK